MILQELLTETVETPSIECWDEESTASALRALAVRFHSAGISYRETAAALESIGIKRSHQAVYQWTHRVGETAPNPPRSAPRRVILLVCETVRPIPDRSVRAVNVEEIKNRHGLAQ